ncbi:MAG: alpha/beta hydrolase [Chloroflexota bacterium]
MQTKPVLLVILAALLLFSACQPTTAPTALPPTTTTAASEPTAVPTDIPAATATPVPAPTDTSISPTDTSIAPTDTNVPALPPLPAEAQRIEFQAKDGTPLVGYYYPAAVNPAPVIVLMHWAGGDQTDWLYVGMVAWLQNRGVEVPIPPTTKYFDTPYLFQPLPENLSFGVFTFDFRGYGESGPHTGKQSELILDAQAAYETATKLEGANATLVAGIGASIGADAAAEGCNEACIAALSLGPGNWLELSYAEAVTAMDALEKPAWCVATEDAPTDLETCNSAAGALYQIVSYPTGGHAMRLFRAEAALDPVIEVQILDFLRLVFDLPAG